MSDTPIPELVSTSGDSTPSSSTDPLAPHSRLDDDEGSPPPHEHVRNAPPPRPPPPPLHGRMPPLDIEDGGRWVAIGRAVSAHGSGIRSSLAFSYAPPTIMVTPPAAAAVATGSCDRASVLGCACFLVVLFVVTVVPGLVCYYGYYIRDRSCDRYQQAVGWVSTAWIQTGSCCDEGGCNPCSSIEGRVSYNLTEGQQRPNTSAAIQCQEVWVLFHDSAAVPSSLELRLNTTLGQPYAIAYDPLDPPHCYLRHCWRMCDDWRAAFWVPWVILAGLVFVCMIVAKRP